MKTSHQSYNRRRWWERFSPFATIFAFLFGVLPLLLAVAALAAPARDKDASILLEPAPGPCAGANLGPGYTGGADAYGRRVAPADLPGPAAVHLDSETVYPVVRRGRHRGGTEVAVNVDGLANILEAPAACSPHR